MLRIGILLDSSTIQAWQAEAIRQILSSGLAEISVLVFNQSPKSPGNPSPIGYRIYRALDRILFKTKWDAFKAVSIDDILPRDIETVTLKPIQKKYRDSFSNADLDRIEEFKLDVLLRFGFRILSGKILTLPKLGVWSYHHGDPAVYRGGPPAFWEVMQKLPITGVALLQLTEKLDQGPVLYQSWTQTDPLSVQRNANKLFWHSSTFLLRALRRLRQDSHFSHHSSSPKTPAPLWTPPSNWAMIGLVWRLMLRTCTRKIMEWRKPAHWEVGQLSLPEKGLPNSIKEDQVRKIHPTGQQVYWADPFPISYQGEEYVFVEEFDRAKKKGNISCVLPDGSSRRVLEESWHLSYPMVWEENGDLYLLPESADAGKLYRYRAEVFPSKWKRESLLFEGEAYDPTLLKKDGLYWLFVNQNAHPACSPFDELFLYFTEDLLQPNWQAHPMNPIVSDVRMSRPAGRIFEKDGKWYRPAQDSGLRYGHRIQVQEIVKLTKEEYQEVTVQTIEADQGAKALGIHTLNFGEKGVWLDFYHRR